MYKVYLLLKTIFPPCITKEIIIMSNPIRFFYMGLKKNLIWLMRRSDYILTMKQANQIILKAKNLDIIAYLLPYISSHTKDIIADRYYFKGSDPAFFKIFPDYQYKTYPKSPNLLKWMFENIPNYCPVYGYLVFNQLETAIFYLDKDEIIEQLNYFNIPILKFLINRNFDINKHRKRIFSILVHQWEMKTIKWLVWKGYEMDLIPGNGN